MTVSDLVEEVEFFFWEKDGCCDGVDWCVAPALVVESTGFVEVFEESLIGW